MYIQRCCPLKLLVQFQFRSTSMEHRNLLHIDWTAEIYLSFQNNEHQGGSNNKRSHVSKQDFTDIIGIDVFGNDALRLVLVSRWCLNILKAFQFRIGAVWMHKVPLLRWLSLWSTLPVLHPISRLRIQISTTRVVVVNATGIPEAGQISEARRIVIRVYISIDHWDQSRRWLGLLHVLVLIERWGWNRGGIGSTHEIRCLRQTLLFILLSQCAQLTLRFLLLFEQSLDLFLVRKALEAWRFDERECLADILIDFVDGTRWRIDGAWFDGCVKGDKHWRWGVKLMGWVWERFHLRADGPGLWYEQDVVLGWIWFGVGGRHDFLLGLVQ